MAPYEGTSIKELITGEFQLRIIIAKQEGGISIKRITAIVPIEECTYIRHLPLTTTIKLMLINSPEVSPYLTYFRKDSRDKFEIKLDGDDKIRRIILNSI